jgi:hypothetical protein
VISSSNLGFARVRKHALSLWLQYLCTIAWVAYQQKTFWTTWLPHALKIETALLPHHEHSLS